MTLELSLSRAEVKRLATRLAATSSRDQANYRTLTDVEASSQVPTPTYLPYIPCQGDSVVDPGSGIFAGYVSAIDNFGSESDKHD